MSTINTKEDVVNNSNQPHGIKTPTTLKEFRENLKKYYWSMGGEGLYVQQHHSPVKYDKIKSLSDLYEIVRKRGDSTMVTPWICPKVNLKKDVMEFMKETDQVFSSQGYFQNEDHFEIVEDQFKQKDPKWVGIDNQIYREFYMMTLGEFSGYVKQ